MRVWKGRVIAVAVAVLCGGSAALQAQDEEKPPRDFRLPPAPPPPPRSQELRFSYRLNVAYPNHIDRNNIATLSMASMDAVHLALQDSADDPFYYRLPKWGAAFAIDSAIRFVGHEYGHLSTFSKAGYRQALFGDRDKLHTSAPKASIGRMFLNGFNPFDQSAVSVSQEDWNRIVADFDEDPVKIARFKVAVKAGGLNQESVTLEHYSDRLLEGRLSYLDTFPFVISGAAVLRYPVSAPMSDVGDYIDELRTLGLRTTAGQLHRLSAITLFSGTSLAAIRGFYLGLTTSRGGTVEPFALPLSDHVRVFAPEFENYLSQHGPTLKPSIPINVHDWWIRPSYERLFVHGASMGEAGLSVRAPVFSFLVLRTAGYRNDGGGSWFEGGFELLPLHWLALGAGYAWAREYSFHRDVYGASNDILERAEAGLNFGLSAFHQF